MIIQVSTKVCNFGKQVVEKVETKYARCESGRFVYNLDRSPMMNFVFESFTILQEGWTNCEDRPSEGCE